MGKRGPRPEPRTLAIAKGSWRGNLKPNEPEEVSGEMKKPEWLGVLAAEKWDELIPVISARGTASPAYVEFLAQFCCAFEDFRNACSTLDSEGDYVHSEKGGVYLHPANSIKFNAIQRMMKFGREFGLSPTSIRDIQASPVKSETSKKRFFA